MTGCRIDGDSTCKGMRVLTLENEFLKIKSLLDKGSDIIEILYKPMGVDFMWHSPLGYRNPATFVPSCSRSDGAFLDFYGGGWQDVLPSAGGKSSNRGAEWGLHGETALIPWGCAIEKDSPEEVVAHLSVECYRYPLRVDKWFVLRRKESSFTIREKLTNLSEQDLEYSWLQHPAFGEPFLAPGTVIDIPAETVVVAGPPDFSPSSRLPAGKKFKWPNATNKKGEKVDLSRLPAKDVRALDLAFLMDLKEGWYAVTNPRLKLGFGLVWNKSIYPYVWFWQPLGGAWDHPWFGRTWNIALEPCTSWPATGLADQIAKGTAAKIRGNGSIELEMKAIAYTGLQGVKRISSEGRVEG